MEKIKAIKLQEQGNRDSALLFIPVWQATDVDLRAQARNVEYTHEHVILCDLPQVEAKQLQSLVKGSHYLSLLSGQHANIAQRYSEYALACFTHIQTILRNKPQGRVLVQIVSPDDHEHALLAGLSGLLRTAALENPQFFGQLILLPPGIMAEQADPAPAS